MAVWASLCAFMVRSMSCSYVMFSRTRSKYSSSGDFLVPICKSRVVADLNIMMVGVRTAARLGSNELAVLNVRDVGYSTIE